MIDLLKQAGIPLIIGGFSAFFAAKLAISKHRKEKIWEKKVEAYIELVEALHNMKRPREILYQLESSNTAISEDSITGLWSRSRDARRRIEKAIDLSSFLISDEMGSTLEAFEKQMEQILDVNAEWAEVIAAEYSVVCECLELIKRQGKTELKL